VSVCQSIYTTKTTTICTDYTYRKKARAFRFAITSAPMEQSFSAGVEFDGVKVRDPDQIRDGWANYFERLSTPSDKDFDTEWKDMVERYGRI